MVEKNLIQPVQALDPDLHDGEVSDDYEDSIEEEEGDDQEEYEEEGDDDDEASGAPPQGSSLTAMLLAGANNAEEDEDEEEDDDDEDDDDDFTPLAPAGVHSAPVLTASTSDSSVLGTKRSRDDDKEAGENGDLSGDYGEVDENREIVKKKARATEPEAEGVDG